MLTHVGSSRAVGNGTKRLGVTGGGSADGGVDASVTAARDALAKKADVKSKTGEARSGGGGGVCSSGGSGGGSGVSGSGSSGIGGGGSSSSGGGGGGSGSSDAGPSLVPRG